MSEKQAKKVRKDTPKAAPVKKQSIFTPLNIIIAVAVIAVLALGVWATAGKVIESMPQPQTVATIAESEGLTVEEFLAKCGLSDKGFTGDTLTEEFFGVYTVANQASYEGLSLEELNEKYGFTDMSEDTLWQEATNKITVGAMAKMDGYEFEEYKTTMGLPEEVTADMTYEEAIEIVQKAAEAAQN